MVVKKFKRKAESVKRLNQIVKQKDCGGDRLVVMVCFDLPVKRCERDRAWLSQLLLLSSMQKLNVWKSGRLSVTS